MYFMTPSFYVYSNGNEKNSKMLNWTGNKNIVKYLIEHGTLSMKSKMMKHHYLMPTEVEIKILYSI